MSAACHHCGAAAVESADPADAHNPLCERCLPIRDHVISMQRAPNGDAVAKCRCGRLYRAKWHYQAQRDSFCRDHWNDVIARATK